MAALDDMMQTNSLQAKPANAQGRRGMAFIIEALLLVVFLAACGAVFMQLLGISGHLSEESLQMNAAVRAATNAAEEFAHNPISFEAPEPGNDLRISVEVRSERAGKGVLYHADITVLDANDEEIYSLQTAKFVPAASLLPVGEAHG